jgi:hypothetical protein
MPRPREDARSRSGKTDHSVAASTRTDGLTAIEVIGPVGASGLIEPPDFFADGARISFSQAAVTIVFLRSRPTFTDDEPTPPHEAVALVRMSPELSAQLSNLIVAALQKLQAQAEATQKELEAAAAKAAE